MLSRTCVIVLPPTMPLSVEAMSSEVTPSWRALSCRTSTFTTRAGSFQSKIDVADALIGADDRGELQRQRSRTFAMSGPLSRYWTGRPTGGPRSSSLT